MRTNKQYGVPVSFYRGGTSKALFFHEKDLPELGLQRDRFLKRAMGSPDPLQLDGMGGSRAVTSKVAIVKKSDREDADVDYTFAQVGIVSKVIYYNANCGNISSAVGPFAIDEGLVEYRPGFPINPLVNAQEVRIYNTGTKKILIAHVPIDSDGLALVEGDCTISGVPGTSAPILMDYRYTIGAVYLRGILPTCRKIDVVNIGGRDIEVTVCDVGNPCVFANAKNFNITGYESAADLTANNEWKANCEQLRGKTAELLGLTQDWKTWRKFPSFIMLPVFVSPPLPTGTSTHVTGRVYLDNMCHESMAGTGAICTAACSRVPGTIVNRVTGELSGLEEVDIAHPIGSIKIRVQTEESSCSELPIFRTLSFTRTARRIMDGTIYVPWDTLPDGLVANGIPRESL